METVLTMEVGTFYDFELDYILPITKIKQGSILTVGADIPAVGCMFNMYHVMCNGVRVGYGFNSKFQVVNLGGLLLTYLNGARGKATKVETLVKSDQLVVYNYPNKGSLAISPLVSPEVERIFQEQ